MFSFKLANGVSIAFAQHREPVTRYYLFSDGQRVASASRSEILVWRLQTQQLIAALPAHTYFVISADEKWLVSSEYWDTGNCCSEYLRIYALDRIGEVENANQSPQIVSDECGMQIWFEPEGNLLWTHDEFPADRPRDTSGGQFVRRSYELSAADGRVAVLLTSSRITEPDDEDLDGRNCVTLLTSDQHSA